MSFKTPGFLSFGKREAGALTGWLVLGISLLTNDVTDQRYFGNYGEQVFSNNISHHGDSHLCQECHHSLR